MAYIEFHAEIPGHQPLPLVEKAAFQGSTGGRFERYHAEHAVVGEPPREVTLVELDCSRNEAAQVLGSLNHTFSDQVRSRERTIGS